MANEKNIFDESGIMSVAGTPITALSGIAIAEPSKKTAENAFLSPNSLGYSSLFAADAKRPLFRADNFQLKQFSLEVATLKAALGDAEAIPVTEQAMGMST